MATYDVTKLTKLGALKELAEKMHTDYATKAELANVNGDAAKALKSGKVNGNTVNLYTSTDGTGDAAFTFDFPAELFLDQTKTTFVEKFAFSADTYVGATDPKLNGKPVMVLAVKGQNPASVTYSFLNMEKLVDTYSAKTTGKDASTTVEISGYEVEVKVNLSKEANNALTLKTDGLHVDISGKADKVAGATSGNFASLDANGNLKDSGKKAADFVAAEDGKRLMTDAEGTKLGGIAEGATKVEKSTTNGNVKVNGVETVVYTEPKDVVHGAIATDEEVAAMLAEVFGA